MAGERQHIYQVHIYTCTHAQPTKVALSRLHEVEEPLVTCEAVLGHLGHIWGRTDARNTQTQLPQAFIEHLSHHGLPFPPDLLASCLSMGTSFSS